MSSDPQKLAAEVGLWSRPPPPPRRRRQAGAVGLSLAAHGLILLAIVMAGPRAATPFAAPPIAVDIVTVPRPTPTPASPPPAPAQPTPPKPPPPRTLFRITKAPNPVDTVPAEKEVAAEPDPGLSDAQLAGAATAGSGAGTGAGGVCDMALRVQNALRHDAVVQAAIAPLSGRALMVWNGDWIWLPGEDGRGITAVRQAMMWEIAFAPKECRAQAMHGLVVISPTERSGSARIALGGGAWRWSDLLTPHPGHGGGAPDEP